MSRVRPEIVALVVFGGFTAIALVGLSVLGAQNRAARRRLAAVTEAGDQAAASTNDEYVPRPDLAPTITDALKRAQILGNLQLSLLRAGLMLRPSEFVAICAGAGLGAAIIIRFVSGSLMTGLIVGAAAACGPVGWLKSRQARRTRAISAQLPDALDMLSASLRSGFSFARGLQIVQSQMHPPIAEEFGRVVDETQFGVSLEAALDHLVARTANYDLELIVSAVQTQLSLGGNLAEILGNIAEMIRERVRLSGEISAATAEGRMSAGILLAMPFGVAILISIVSPAYLAPLFAKPLGWAMLGGGALLMLLGTITIKKMMDIDV